MAGFMALCASAQTANDALLFSENNYEGTARTIAMGNAFTALGGDLGSIGINPAGSAVANYSQITLTPALSFAASTTQGVPPLSSSNSLPYFEQKMRNRTTKFGMPNIGMTFNYETGRSSGITNFTVGFAVNQTADWNEDTYAAGTNNTTTFMGAMAYEATLNGYTGAQLGDEKAYEYIPWKPVVGYLSGMIAPFGGRNDQFIGASEIITENGDIQLGGELEQEYGRRVEGGKYDYLINFGMNISDFVYIGANIGISSINYSYSEYFKENAVNPENFAIDIDMMDGTYERIHFKNMRYMYDYHASGMGFYGKLGVIVTPGNGLRIGAAIQTPTATGINEEWIQGGETTYDKISYNDDETSPQGKGSYNMTSPFRANFGLAYALGQFGVISADYEFCDYGQMRFSTNGYDRDYFEKINTAIKKDMRASHMLRVGAEIKPMPEFAIRAGYGMTTSPEEYLYNMEGASIIRNQNVSLGLGYSSDKSFFADFAVKRTFIPDEYFMPYSDYIFDEDGYVLENGFAPEILNRRSLWKVMLTLGWRF